MQPTCHHVAPYCSVAEMFVMQAPWRQVDCFSAGKAARLMVNVPTASISITAYACVGNAGGERVMYLRIG